jgi:DNA polymerase I-like protein with 3'-5' exonuclease and polymerase domains
MNVRVLDFETALFRPGVMAPEAVCFVWRVPGEEPGIMHAEDPRALSLIRSWLEGPELLVGHNVVYDLAVMCARWPELTQLVFKKYDKDEISCTKLRQQLLDIAAGEFRGYLRKFETEACSEDCDTPETCAHTKVIKHGERFMPHKYDLADLVRRIGGKPLDKDTWRMRYGEFLHVPLSEWPEGARTYPLEDARATLDVFLKQEEHVQYIPDQYRQARAAWALHLTSVWGLRTHKPGVDKLERETLGALAEIEEDLKAAGLVRANGKRNIKAARALMVQVCEKLKKPVRLTAKGQVCLDSDACEASEYSLLEDYAELSVLKAVLAKDIPMLRAGTEQPVHTSFGLAASGRVTSSKPNTQNLRRSVGIRECFIPRPGKVFAQADFSGLELHTLAQCCVTLFGESHLAEVLNAGLDPHTAIAADILGISYEEGARRKKDPGDEEFDNARQTGKVCFHPETEVLTRTGWVPIAQVTTDTEIAVPQLASHVLNVSLQWEKPLRVTSRTALELVRVSNKSMDVRVTPDHNMAGWAQVVHQGGRKTLNEKSLKATETNRYRYIPNAGKLVEGEELPRRFVRMLVATQADGSYTDSGKIRFGFTKARKIQRFRWLFEGFYTESASSQGAVTFVVEGELADHIKRYMPDKTLTESMLSWSFESRLTLVRETRFWDGHVNVNKEAKWTRGLYCWSYCSTIKRNADVLTALCATVGYKTSVYLYERFGENLSNAYVVTVKQRLYTRGGNIEVKAEPYGGLVHCLTTTSGFVLVRANGKTVITRQCNFGMGGGLGAEKLVLYARKSYGVILTEDRARELKAQWLERWPEMKKFFQHVSDLLDEDTGEGQITQLFSQRIRSGCRYTALANSYFQGLGADAAKRAHYLVARACYAETTNVLYGSRPVNQVHDETSLEVDDNDLAHDKAMELGRLMILGANEFLPDVPARIEPLLSRIWSKKAKPVFKEGRLIPWAA